MKSQKEI